MKRRRIYRYGLEIAVLDDHRTITLNWGKWSKVFGAPRAPGQNLPPQRTPPAP